MTQRPPRVLLALSDGELAGGLTTKLAAVLPLEATFNRIAGLAAAEAELRQADYDALVLDPAREGTVGWSLVRRLREQHPSLALVAIVAAGDERAGILALSDGVHEVVEGAADAPAQLWRAVRRAIARARFDMDAQHEPRQQSTCLDNLGLGSFVAAGDRQLAFTKMSVTFAQLLGYDSVEEARGLSLTTVAADHGEIASMARELSKNGIVPRAELLLRRRDGTTVGVTCSATAERDEAGRLARVYGVVVDTTSRRALERAIVQHEETMRVTLNALEDPAYIMNAEGTIRLVNEAAGAYFRVGAATLPGMLVYDLLPQGAAEELRQFVASVVQSGSPVRFVHQHEAVSIDTLVCPVFNKQGRVGRLAVFARDVTNRARTEESIHRTGVLLHALSRAQSEYIGGTDLRIVFGELLDHLLLLTESECGLVVQAQKSEDHTVGYSVAVASAPFGYDEWHGFREGQAAVMAHAPTLDALLTEAMSHGEVEVVNDVEAFAAERSLPIGHAQLSTAAVLPLTSGGRVSGAVCVANRPGGYLDEQVAYFTPLLSTCAAIMEDCEGEKARDRAERELRENQERLALAQQMASIGSWYLDVGGDVLQCSDEACRLLGVDPESYDHTLDAFLALVHPDDQRAAREGFVTALAGLSALDIEHRIVRADGSVVDVHERGEVSFSAEGWPVRMLGTIHDITARKQAEEELREREARARAVFETAADGIVTVGEQGLIESMNAAAEALFGWKAEEVIGRNVSILVPTDRCMRHEAAVRGAPSSGTNCHATESTREVVGMRCDGTTIPLDISVGAVELHGRRAFTTVVRDATQRRLAEDELRRLSDVDALTGIANRRKFDQTLDTELRRAKRTGTSLALMFIDIDEFKAYNDSYGHPAGDACLRCTAAALSGMLRRAGDFVARHGGEEFAVILAGTDEEHSGRVAEALRARVEAETTARVGAELPSKATISIGVAWLTPGPSVTAAALVEAADRALYAAKQSGRNRVCYAPDVPGAPTGA